MSMRRRPQRFPETWGPRVQPQTALVGVTGEQPYHLFWPRSVQDRGTAGGPLVRNAGTETLVVGRGGVGWDFSVGTGTRIVYRPTIVPPNASGWTYEFLVSVASVGSTDLCRFNQTATPSGANDRRLSINSSGFPNIYVFDGGLKNATHTTAVVANTVHHVAATCSSSSLTVFLDGVASTSTATANSGFPGYGAPHWMVGHNSSAQIFMAVLWHRAFSAAEVGMRARTPYAILTPVG